VALARVSRLEQKIGRFGMFFPLSEMKSGSCRCLSTQQSGMAGGFPRPLQAGVRKRAALSQNLLLQAQPGGQPPAHPSRSWPVQSSGWRRVPSLEVTPRALCHASSKEASSKEEAFRGGDWQLVGIKSMDKR